MLVDMRRSSNCLGLGFLDMASILLRFLMLKQLTKFRGLLSVIEGQATEEKLERELKNLIKLDWYYHVKELDRNEFSAAFPGQLSLNTFSKLTDVGLAIYGIKVKISKTNIDRAASSILHSTWIRIGGLPAFAKKEEVVKEVASLVAKPLKVDSFVCLGMNQ